MNTDTDTFPVKSLPMLLDKTMEIQSYIRTLSYIQARKLWNCNDNLARLNYERHQNMDLRRNLTPAVIAYEGIQYQYMAPVVFTEKALRYIDSHLFILSGFYTDCNNLAKASDRSDYDINPFWYTIAKMILILHFPKTENGRTG